MRDSTDVCERPLATEQASLQPRSPAAPGAGTPRRVASWPLVAMAAGLVVLAVAATMVARPGQGARPQRRAGPVISPDPTAITVSARDVSVVIQVYEPGQHSGWHEHSGIHAVAVLSGVMTVYDATCHTETYQPGRPYVGGQQSHMVGNETDSPVTLAVTYLAPSGPVPSTQHLPAPAGCTTG